VSPAPALEVEIPLPQEPPGEAVDEAELSDYQDQLRAAIEREKRYPRLAVRQQIEGLALVGFRVQRDGRIGDIRILESSGQGLLDEAALAAVRQVGQAQPLPAGSGAHRDFEIALEFRLF
jgi:protein TonB